jgi:EAL domain-containing protein (putative c-di-GMP-specific phosphodiesterase class I)
MAHALGLLVIAEGVERAEQREGLVELRCDQAQGMFLAPPGPPDDVEEQWLVTGRTGAGGRARR